MSLYDFILSHKTENGRFYYTYLFWVTKKTLILSYLEYYFSADFIYWASTHWETRRPHNY